MAKEEKEIIIWREEDFLTYDQFFARRKPRRIPKMSDMFRRPSRFAGKDLWNSYVETGRTTITMESRLIRLLRLGYDIVDPMVAATIKRIRKGYL